MRVWVSGLERLVEPLKNTCTMKVKANSVKQEYEKQDELKRSALRAVAALLTIPEAGKTFYLKEETIFFFLLFVTRCLTTRKLTHVMKFYAT